MEGPGPSGPCQVWGEAGISFLECREATAGLQVGDDSFGLCFRKTLAAVWGNGL